MQNGRQRLGKGFDRRVFRAMTGMVLAAAIAVVALAVINANHQNEIEIEAERRLAETALLVQQREIGRNLKDYAVREDAFVNLHRAFSYEWAAAEGNLGPNIFTSLGYEMAFVIAPGGNTLYATIEGQPQQRDAFELLPDGLVELVERGRAQSQPAMGFLRSEGRVVLAAAAGIGAFGREGSGDTPSESSTLVFVKRLNAPLVARIGSDYLLARLRLVGEHEGSIDASFPLASPAGTPLGRIAWLPEQPGYESLRLLIPPIAVTFVVFSLFAAFTLRYARRSSSELEASARMVEAYADTVRHSEARFRDVAEASSDWIWECDSRLRLVYVSSRFTEATGLDDADAIGRELKEFFEVEEIDEGRQDRASVLSDHRPFRDLRCRYRDPSCLGRVCRLSARAVFDDAGAFAGYRGTATDITQEVEAQARAVHLSLHDALTGLPNRVRFGDALSAAFDEAQSGGSRIAVVCLDLDHFKEVNDTLGHASGDVLLREAAERMRRSVNTSDVVARLGGDEFAILQSGVNQPFDATVLSRRLIDVLSAPFVIDGQQVYVGVSLGIAVADEQCISPSALLKNADIALYRAKQDGKGTFRVFEIHMDLELQARRTLEQDLRQAIAREELEVHYQPLITLEDEKIAGVEALVRWRHPERGLVPPNDFIPLAEDTGLIVAIGDWVLRTACTQAVQWPDLVVAVNLSAVQFKYRDLVERVAAILRETGLPAERLELEVTESVLMHDMEAAIAILTSLKEAGVRIVMDDFGTGYSSLGYLNSFPFDKIKIDKSFISDLNADKSNAIVRSVIGLGQSLNMVTTAEGVESAEQAAFLRREGCEQVQGYHFSRPVPAAEMNRLIEGWQVDRSTAA